MFISLRWRAVFPLAIAVMVVAMVGAYAVASVLSEGYGASEENILLQSVEGVLGETVRLYEVQVGDAVRVAYTQGVAETVRDGGDVSALVDTLKSLASLNGADVLLATNAGGVEIAGVQRVATADGAYSVSVNTSLRDETMIAGALAGRVSTALVRTSEGLMLMVAVPLTLDGANVGALALGRALPDVIARLKTSAIADVAFYAPDGGLAGATLALSTANLEGLRLPEAIRGQVLGDGATVKTATTLEGALYRVVYSPFAYGEAVLGVVGVFTPNSIPFATELGRQVTALLSATLAGVAVVVVFGVVHRASQRLERVAETAEALARGDVGARTGMSAGDEVGAVAQALDRFADESMAQQDQFRTLLRRERRERAYLFSVLESLPHGVVVQDNQGQVLVMNEQARILLGSQTSLASALQGFQHVVDSMLGSALAPGIYALGKPQMVERDGTMLSAQAAAVLSPSQERLGTVILLRDITEEVRQVQAREHLLSQLSEDIQQPLQEMAQTGANARQPLVNAFARDISKHAAALQKMIVDMRELTRYTRTQARQAQRVLSVETLVWAVANDWRQIAQAASLTLTVTIGKGGLFVLGDESRLRLALGNVVDNAIRYTPAGGTVSLEIKDEIGNAVHLRVRDNGVGIHADDMPHIFTPFYRGSPVDSDGNIIRVPGMGQGLPMAKGIIEAHGGMIRVKSRVGVGTAVYFALPLTSGVSYSLPMLSVSDLEGDTVNLPPNADLEAFWR